MSSLIHVHNNQKDTEKQGSGYIWDYAEMPSDVKLNQLTEIESTWRCIPKLYTQHIRELIICGSSSPISGGAHDTVNNIVKISIGYDDLKSGVSATLYHEIHHNMWERVRTLAQKHEWERGAFNIMLHTGKSPTRYSDSFIPSLYEFEKIMIHYKQIMNYKNSIDSITINDCYPGYDDLKTSLKNDEYYMTNWIDRVICPISRNDMRLKQEKINNINDQFDKLTAGGKLQLIKKNHAGMQDEMDACFAVLQQCQVFNESHSETGAFIHAENSMRMRASWSDESIEWDQSLNNSVINRYVLLYHKVFG